MPEAHLSPEDGLDEFTYLRPVRHITLQQVGRWDCIKILDLVKSNRKSTRKP